MERSEYLEQKFRHSPSMVSRRVVDEFILVPIRRSAGELQSIYTADEVGGRIWELIDGQARVRDIRDAIVGEYDVSVEQAEDDLVAFLQQLEKVGAVEVA